MHTTTLGGRKVRFGDVYVCVGGGEMLRPLVGPAAAAAPPPPPPPQPASVIRRFSIDAGRASHPLADVRGAWHSGSAGLQNFSRLCWDTARQLVRLDPAGHGVGNTTGSGYPCQSQRCTMPIGERAVSIVCTAVLADISLCHACSCPEILRVETARQG
eukprot:COSAG01_NODE_5749_length_4060_cov_2.425398_2_plen_158_part_00